MLSQSWQRLQGAKVDGLRFPEATGKPAGGSKFMGLDACKQLAKPTGV